MLEADKLLGASGENCTFHLEVSADARCSRCGRPFCRACLTLVQTSPATTGSGLTITLGGSGGLVCIECKIRQEVTGGLILTSIGVFWLIVEFLFLGSVPEWARSFFSGPLTISSLMGIGIIAFGISRYASGKGKLQKFQANLPLKAKSPAQIELGVAKCPNCGGVLKKVPQKPGEIVLCGYCGAPITLRYSVQP